MLTIDPKTISVPKMHGYLLGAIVPRPIAFVSSCDSEGKINLAPFSFFNAFSANPPTLVFSPARRGRDNTTKHTLENVKQHPEVVINVVNHRIVEQMSLTSTEYDAGVNEFIKAGLTMVESEKVRPPRVGESPVSFECQVKDIQPLGYEGGAGNLVICEVVLGHFQEEILDEDQRVDPAKLDAVARLGGNWYSRVTPESIFEIPKPLTTQGIGVDQIPEPIRNSHILSGNDLGRLGNVEQLPSKEEVDRFSMEDLRSANNYHEHAKLLLKEGKVLEAWLTLLKTVY